MNHGSRQLSAWTIAVGLSGSIYGGGAYWLKVNASHSPGPAESSTDNEEQAGEKPEEHAAAANEEHAEKHEEHAAAANEEHAEKHEEHAAAPHEEHAEKHEEHAAAAHEEHAEKPAEQPAEHKPHWTYGKTDAAGPSHWGDLAQEFSTCEKGMEQSPIDIRNATPSSSAPKIVWHYDAAKLKVENNGHTVQSITETSTNYVTIDGDKYSLAQFHFHNPSEHRIGGVPSDMEMHLVHKNAAGKLAVIGVLINERAGMGNKSFKPIWDVLPREKNTKVEHAVEVKLTSLLPPRTEYVHYKGSLTTPPCSEGVRWFVLKEPVTMSTGQVEMYTSIFETPTNRPVQPVQGREVITNGAPALAH